MSNDEVLVAQEEVMDYLKELREEEEQIRRDAVLFEREFRAVQGMKRIPSITLTCILMTRKHLRRWM